MGEWKPQSLGKFAEFKNGKARPMSEGQIPVYGGNGILGYSDRFNSENEVVIIGRVGAYCGSVYYENKPIWISDNAMFALPKNGGSAKFLYYFLRDLDLNSLAEGSSHPLLTQTLLNSIETGFPEDVDEQKAIAEVLSSLDAKIDLLHRQNKTLESLAETLFRHWFIDQADEGWETRRISDFAAINLSSIDKDYPYDEIEYLDTGSITDNIVSEYQHMRLEDAPSRAKRIVRDNDIVISLVRPIQRHYGLLKKTNPNTIVSTGFCVVSCTAIDPHFIYLLLTQSEMTEHLESVAEGSTSAYPSLKPSDIAGIEFKVPPDTLLGRFSDYAASAWGKIETNREQIQTLTKLRDSLLPRLMDATLTVRK